MICTGKRKFRSRKDAHAIMVKFTPYDKRIDDTTKLNVYKCPLCGAWHIGHKRRAGA